MRVLAEQLSRLQSYRGNDVTNGDGETIIGQFDKIVNTPINDVEPPINANGIEEIKQEFEIEAEAAELMPTTGDDDDETDDEFSELIQPEPDEFEKYLSHPGTGLINFLTKKEIRGPPPGISTTVQTL